MSRCRVVWANHPRHLPPAPNGRVVVVDVAFAAGKQFHSKTKPFLDAIGDRLVAYVDHHEHRAGWPLFADNPRFVLVKNKDAHACPELITPERVAECESARGKPDAIVAHCDFDGAIAAVKWCLDGREPWPHADEDARAVDSPGRGHTLTSTGARIAWAMDEASSRFERDEQHRFMTAVVESIVSGESSLALDEEIDTLAASAQKAEIEALAIAKTHGSEEAPGVFVVRVESKVENRMRRNLLLAAEERGRIGALFEPDPTGGSWLTAATFDETLDLEEVAGFEGGRSDYRFARVEKGGREGVAALGRYLEAHPRSSTNKTADRDA